MRILIVVGFTFLLSLAHSVRSRAENISFSEHEPLPKGAVARLGHANLLIKPYYCAGITPDGKYLVNSSGEYWEIESGRQAPHKLFLPKGYYLDKMYHTGYYLVGARNATKYGVCKLGEERILHKGYHEQDDEGNYGVRVVKGEDAYEVQLANLRLPGDYRWQTVFGMPEEAYRKKFASAGRKILIVEDGSHLLHVYEPANKKLRTLEVKLENSDVHRHAAISPDGKIVASQTDRWVIFRDADTGNEWHRVEARLVDNYHELMFTPDGKYVILTSYWEGVLVVPTDPKKEKHFFKNKGYGIYGAVLFPAGNRIALIDDLGVIRIHDLQSGQQLDKHSLYTCLHGVAWMDERRALAWTAEGYAIVWDTKTGRASSQFQFAGDWVLDTSIKGITLAPTGKHAALWSYCSVGLCEIGSGKLLGNWLGDQGSLRPAAAFDKRGQVFSAMRAEDNNLTLKTKFTLLEVPTCEVKKTLPFSRGCSCFADDGRTIYHADERHIGWYELATGKPRWRIPFVGQLQRESWSGSLAAFPALHRLILTLDKDIYRINSLTGQMTLVGRFASKITATNGRFFVTTMKDGNIGLFDLDQAEPEHPIWKSEPLAESSVTGFALSLDGKRLLSSHREGVCIVWDLSDKVESRPNSPINNVNSYWEQLAKLEPTEAQPALLALLADPPATVKLLSEKLAPATEVPVDKIAKHINQLGNETFAVREAASAELGKVFDQAESLLREALKHTKSIEVKDRINSLLETHGARGNDPQYLQQLRALEILERIGNAEAQHLLARLAKGAPLATLTREAKDSLERLKK